MKYLLTFLCISFCTNLFAGIAHDTEMAVRNERSLRPLARATDIALERLIETATGLLRERHDPEGDRMSGAFKSKFKNYVAKQYELRNIGDFKPLSDYLAIVYEYTGLVLECGIPGKVDLCEIAHLTDIKTLNYAIPVVFRPCGHEWKKADYKDHFSGDGKLYGLFPVTVFWGCIGGTFSVGWAFVCTPAEFASEKLVAPYLSDLVYDSFCSSNS